MAYVYERFLHKKLFIWMIKKHGVKFSDLPSDGGYKYWDYGGFRYWFGTRKMKY